jgi:hypothetical protein
MGGGLALCGDLPSLSLSLSLSFRSISIYVYMYKFSGMRFDTCGKCGGDNSSCMGCDGVPVAPAVTARLKVLYCVYVRALVYV